MERLDAPVQHEEFELSLPPAPESAERVLILEQLSVGYGDNVLLHDIDLVLRKGEKVGLLGPNGTGKTTLLKTVLGELPPLKGTARIGSRVKVGYFSQSYERLAPRQTLLDNFLVEYGFTEERTRSLLGGMLVHGDDVFKEIGTLSGGQKARLVLLKLVLDGANCLVLDEPTNHLDIMARETVEAALTAFDGTVLVVSHDRYFINEIADRIWELEDHRVYDYKGNYDFYLEEKAKRQAQQTAEIVPGKPAAKTESETESRPTKNAGKNKRTYSPQEAEKLLAKVELSIREQEALLGVLEQRLADPASHTDPEASAALAAEHAALQAEIGKLMLRWNKTRMERVMTDKDYMQLALQEARAAAAIGEIPIGAVLVVAETVVARAHNMRETWNDATAHAEIIVIREACKRLGRWRLEGAALYVTVEPCPMCSGAIVNSRIEKVVYGCPDAKAGGAESIFNIISNSNLNHKAQVVSGVCEAECAQVMKDFFRRRRLENRQAKADRTESSIEN